MGEWKAYVYSMIVCSLCCEIVLQIISDTHKRNVVQMVSGVVLAIAILKPLSNITLEDFLQVPTQNWNCADGYIAEGEQLTWDAQASGIKASCETYILNKASTLGAEITVGISLNEDLLPVFAEISGTPDSMVQRQLQEILATDLGIPKENQEWIGNQESNSS